MQRSIEGTEKLREMLQRIQMEERLYGLLDLGFESFDEFIKQSDQKLLEVAETL